MKGLWCRFRREARARERHRTVVVDSLKALDPKRPIREADIRPDSAPPDRLELIHSDAPEFVNPVLGQGLISP